MIQKNPMEPKPTLSYREVWDRLSQIDLSEFIERKGGYSYLSWTHAWRTMMEHYPDSEYELRHETLPNGNVMTYCEVRVGFLRRNMWLAVMTNTHRAIENPTASDIANTYMRCLVKCLAMFGLGHYIYSGEDLPAEPLADREARKAKEAALVAERKERAKEIVSWIGTLKTVAEMEDYFRQETENDPQLRAMLRTKEFADPLSDHKLKAEKRQRRVSAK